MERRLRFPELKPEHLREYVIRVAVYETVDNQGVRCTYCQLLGNRVEVNIHATDMGGQPLYAQTCLNCALPVVDTVLELDPSHVVVLEVAEQ